MKAHERCIVGGEWKHLRWSCHGNGESYSSVSEGISSDAFGSGEVENSSPQQGGLLDKASSGCTAKNLTDRQLILELGAYVGFSGVSFSRVNPSPHAPSFDGSRKSQLTYSTYSRLTLILPIPLTGPRPTNLVPGLDMFP